MPDLKLWSTTPSRMYLGSTSVQYVYLGSTLVWPIQVEPDSITIQPTNYLIELTSSGSFLVNVSATGIWSASTNDNWITVTKTNVERATVAYTENNSVGSRQGTVTFTCGEASAILTVEQKGISGSITVTGQPTSNLSAQHGSFEVEVTANTNWTSSTNVDWINPNYDSGSGSAGTYTVTVPFDTNESVSQRTGTITFTTKDGVSTSFTVTQNGNESFIETTANIIANNWYNDTNAQFINYQSWRIDFTGAANNTVNVLNIVVLDQNDQNITTLSNAQTITLNSYGKGYIGASKVNDHGEAGSGEEGWLSYNGQTVENNGYKIRIQYDSKSITNNFSRMKF